MAGRTSTKAEAPQIKPAQIRKFHAALAAWYKAHGRHDLPWRTTDDPYHIWISEVMLQQTQVATVRERFYPPFLKAFPTIESLAAAPQQSVLKAWEGLGYYSRARNLHKAAQQIIASSQLPVASHEPTIGHNSLATDYRLPATREGLLALSGIGRNTAHAILAFGHHQPVAILEANVKRVVARIFALETPNDQQLWDGADTLLSRDHPFDYNQAMMDIGSLICTPKHPKCTACPANMICLGQKSPERYPTKKAKKQTPTREVIITVAEDSTGRLHLTTRGEKLLGGLYGFPQNPHPKSQKVISGEGTLLGIVTHVYSHFKLIGTVIHQRVPKPTGAGWFTREEIKDLPLSKLDHKVLALLTKNSPCGTHLIETSHTSQKKRTKAAQ